jgi:putative transposase
MPKNSLFESGDFDSLQEVRQMTVDWLHRYNHHWSHESLDRIPPTDYRVKQFLNLTFG